MPADNIFTDTLAEMTWFEAQDAVKAGAIALWAFGVIEQHGPHLPTGTDVYLPSARLRRVKALLAERGIPSIIIPPFYWGVNKVSASFPASFTVRPEIMIELMGDVLKSLARDGFKRVFCITGHGDAAHNRAIYDGVSKGVAETGIDISFAADEGLIARLGLDPADPQVTPIRRVAGPPSIGIDVHAGSEETSEMLALVPELVKEKTLPTLEPVEFTREDLAEWRLGADKARSKTPLGYVGYPRNADAQRGSESVEQGAIAMAEAIAERIGDGRP